MATVSENKLKGLIKESVREVMSGEFMKFRALSVPFVSDKEQKDIEKSYDKPSRNRAKEFFVSI